jgi:hypothetical protein
LLYKLKSVAGQMPLVAVHTLELPSNKAGAEKLASKRVNTKLGDNQKVALPSYR